MVQLARHLRVLAADVEQQLVAVVLLGALWHAAGLGRAVRALDVELLRQRGRSVLAELSCLFKCSPLRS